jgi:hypothetical protein
MVARPEMIDPEKFGVTVGRNNGLVCDVFPSEPEAEAWLRNLKGDARSYCREVSE